MKISDIKGAEISKRQLEEVLKNGRVKGYDVWNSSGRIDYCILFLKNGTNFEFSIDKGKC